MKKILVVFAVLSTMILASCGGKGVQSEGTDSVAVDSVAVDSVAVEGEEVIGGGSPGSIDEEKNSEVEAVK